MNAVAPTMLSSSNVPQPEFACRWPNNPSDANKAAYSGRCSPFMIRCCQSMFTWTLSSPSARNFDTTNRHMPMFRIRIFIAGSEFLCSRNSLTPCSRQTVAASAMPSISHRHESA